MMRSFCCALSLGVILIAPAALEARPQAAATRQVDPFYLKMLDAGERSVKAGAFTDAARDLEIAVFGLGRSPRLTGKAYLLLAVCRDALLDKDKSRSDLRTAAGLLEPEGVNGLDLDERTLAVVRNLVDAYKIPLTLPPPPASPPAPKKAVPEKEKLPEKAAAPEKPKVEEAKPAAKNEAKTTPPPSAPKVAKTVPEAKKPSEKRDEKPKNAETRPGSKPEVKKAPTKTEAPPPKKEKAPPAKSPDRIEGPKPVFRAPGESLPDVRELENKLAADPANAALVYEIVPRYYERRDFKAARRALEGLRAKRPLDLRGRLLLAKTDFFLKDYAGSLEEWRAISSPGSKARPGLEDSRTISLFTAFCLAYLDQIRSAASILEPLRAGMTPDQFIGLIDAEGLAAHWAFISPRFGK